MLELATASAGIAGCFAQPDALDRLESDGHFGIRVAADELHVLVDRPLLGTLEAELAALDPDSLVVDLSSGFSTCIIRGDDRSEAFGRLCEIALERPPGVIQGLFAEVPARILVRDDEIVVHVSSVLAEHVRTQILAACADLVGARAADAAPRPLVGDEAAAA